MLIWIATIETTVIQTTRIKIRVNWIIKNQIMTKKEWGFKFSKLNMIII